MSNLPVVPNEQAVITHFPRQMKETRRERKLRITRELTVFIKVAEEALEICEMDESKCVILGAESPDHLRFML